MQQALRMFGMFRMPALIAGWMLVSLMSMVQAAAPTGITLTPAVVTENWPAGSLVGTLAAVDADPVDSFTFSLAPGDGADDNAGFYIIDNKLFVRHGVTLDYETELRDLLVRLRVKDSSYAIHEQQFLIPVLDDRTEDVDGDGVSEGDEEDLHGTSDTDADFDDDGVSDGCEVAANPPTSPADPNAWPANAIVGWGSSADRELASPPAGGVITLATGQKHSLSLGSSGTVSAWGGHDSYGQTTVPAGLQNVIEVAAGGDFWLNDSGHSLALKSDGTVVAWGFDYDGKLSVPAGLGQVRAIATGRTHSVALKTDGTVITWGHNPHGSIEPPAGLTDVVAISARGFYSVALRSDGTVVAWGSNFDGENWVDASSPVGLRDVVAISAGRFHCLALKHDGSVVSWGFNSHGQTQVPAGLAEVVAVDAGGFHSMALKSDGTIVTWGSNSNGQCTVPASAGGGVKLISAGILHSMAVTHAEGYPAITSNPRVLSSPGAGVSHQVIVSNAQPISFAATGLPPGLSLDPQTGLISGSAGPARNSVRIEVETDQGFLTQSAWIGISEGSPPASIALTPASVVENSAAGTVVGTLSATDPDAGDTFTYEWVEGPGSADIGMFRIEGDQIIVDSSMARNFEQNSAAFSIRVRARDSSLNPYEQVLAIQFADDRTEDADGDGLTEAQEEDQYSTSDTLADSDGDGFGDGFEVARGYQPNSSTDFPAGRILLGWGSDPDGRLQPPPGVDYTIDLAAGATHSLALRSDGTVVAWGGNGSGQATVPADLAGIIAVGAGEEHSLAIRNDGTLSAWGGNGSGQCTIPEGLADVVAISAGGFHNLALKNDGSVVAWGDNANGQCAVPADLTGVVAVAAGRAHSMALKNDGTVVVWGSNADGVATVPAGLAGVRAISAGGFHCLALTHAGEVVAWGSDSRGQSSVPVITGSVRGISAGRLHSLAWMADGTMAAWGDNTYGQTSLPLEAAQIRNVAAGDFHNVAVRQSAGFPAFGDVSDVRAWPGETVSRTMPVLNAVPVSYSASGLPPGLSINPVSGLVSGVISTGARQAVRVFVVTDQGILDAIIWFNTADGVAPTEIALSSNLLAENCPSGTVVGTLSAADSNAGDSHVFQIAHELSAPDGSRFLVSGNQLVVNGKLNADYDMGETQLVVRVRAIDAGNNAYERDFTISLTDDRTEDADGDGLKEAVEEDVLGSSDSVFDDYNVSDSDQDGVSGLIEYAFNLNPKVAGLPVRLVAGAGSTAGLPSVVLVADGQGGSRLRIEYLRRIAAGLTYVPQFSSDPGSSWSTATSQQVTPVNAEWERCVVEDVQSVPPTSRRFARVRVSW